MLLLSVIVVMLSGCSGKSQTVTPDEKNFIGPTKPDLGMFRNLLWTNPPDPDELIPDSPPAPSGERNADITNVVYDNSYGYYAGAIKVAGIPSGDNYTYTVAAWEVPEDGYSDIYFKVLYRDGSGNYGSSPNIMVTNSSEQIFSWPAVTAHLNADGCIVVDIAYQFWDDWTGRWGVSHARSIQETAQVFTSFQEETPLPGFVHTEYDCQHPDIVFDAAPGAVYWPPYNRLHGVFEMNAGWGNESSIYYVKADEVGGTLYLGDMGYLSTNSSSDYCERPRIDVGYDDSEIAQTLFGVESIYYVGVVWNTMNFTGGLSANVEWCGIWAEDFLPNPPWPVQLTDAWNLEFNVYPYIEIDPVELGGGNNPRFTHVVWTNTYLEQTGFEDAIVYGLYSGQIMDPQNPPPPYLYFPIGFSGVRDGLPTFATLTKEVEMPHGWVRAGYLTWVVDDGPNDTDIKVYASWLEYDKDAPYNYYPDPGVQIGGGDTSIYDPYVYGPDVAIFNETWGRCIWTDFDDGSPYSILGDLNEL